MNNYKADFQKGDIIEYADEHFEVVENYGYSGTVKEYWNGNYGDTITNFKWEAYGERCKLINKESR